MASGVWVRDDGAGFLVCGVVGGFQWNEKFLKVKKLVQMTSPNTAFFPDTKLFNYISVPIIITKPRILANYKLVFESVSCLSLKLKLFQSQSAFSLRLSQNVQNLYIPVIGHSDRIVMEKINEH